ncbi:MAG: hypothetical protein JRH10_22005 [Deltaproteobacteria bacterium]|nr:hypothetical protein [Deltaproteobacteria bacterium]
MRRKRFTHLHTELSVAVGSLVPRYALWACLEDAGFRPGRLARDEALAFLDRHLGPFLDAQHLRLGRRQARRLAREVGRFDPSRPTPEEVMERFAGAFRAPPPDQGAST